MVTTEQAEKMVVRNPATGEEVGAVPVATPEEVARAVERARAVQAEWCRRSFRERAAVLRRFHDLLFERREELLDTLQRESGKTRRDALGELLSVAGTARYYLAHGREPLRKKRRRGAVPLLTAAWEAHEPYGVVGFITPWNYPLLLGIGDALPALLAGNAVVIKPSELTPLSAHLAVDLLRESGLDPDLAQVVDGDGKVGAELIRHVDYVGFTGSVETGRKVAVATAQRLIPVSLELGGKNPMIVLEGAPLDEAVEGFLTGAFYNSGQTCIAVERVYVEDSIFDEFARRAVERTSQMKVGWSLDWDMDMGCLISRQHTEKVLSHVRDAVEKGVRVLTGGRRLDHLGETFMEPTLLTEVTEEMELCCQETFGPVVALYRVAGAEEAIARANDSSYGLNASVWSGSRRRSREVARRIQAGSVGINGTLLIYNTFDVPMGGFKESGLGRRHGDYGILRFTQSQAVVASVATGGGYETIIRRIHNPRRARLLAGAFWLWRRIPGLR